MPFQINPDHFLIGNFGPGTGQQRIVDIYTSVRRFGKQQDSPIAPVLVVKYLGEDGVESEMDYSAGNIVNITPSNDGETSLGTEVGLRGRTFYCSSDPEHGTLSKACWAAMWLTSAEKGGMPKTVFASPFFDGMVGAEVILEQKTNPANTRSTETKPLVRQVVKPPTGRVDDGGGKAEATPEPAPAYSDPDMAANDIGAAVCEAFKPVAGQVVSKYQSGWNAYVKSKVANTIPNNKAMAAEVQKRLLDPVWLAENPVFVGGGKEYTVAVNDKKVEVTVL